MSNTTTRRIPAGRYRGRGIAGSEQYGTTRNGNDQIVIDLDLLDIGERTSTFLVFSNDSAPYSIDRLRALGWSTNDLTNLAGIDRNEVDVEVKYEMYQGEEKMKVQILTGGGVVLKDKLDDKGKKAFAARYKDLAASTTPAPGAVAPAPSRHRTEKAPADFGQSQGGSDDIPF
jgi:hypothetical protein